MRTLHFVAAAVALMGFGVAQAAVDERKAIKYACNDLVVVGTIQNIEGTYEHVEIEDDILGHGWMTAYVGIERVLRGREARAAVYAKYFGHAQIMFRPRQRNLVILRPTDEGFRIVDRFHDWKKSRSNLAKACE